MTPAPNKTKAAAELRCRNMRMSRGGWESPRLVACQDRDVAGVWDILDESWLHPSQRDPRRIPLCRECAEDMGLTAGPIATSEDLPAMIDGGVCWCRLSPGLRICWCPSHGLLDEEE